MALKDIYTNAIDKVVNGDLTKEELWEIFEEHINILKHLNEKNEKEISNLNRKYEHLLKQTKEAYDEHKRVCGG